MTTTQISRQHLAVSLVLAWRDVKSSYKRTRLGPFWGTITSGVMILTLWLVFGNLFTDKGYFAYLACGILLWSIFSGTLGSSNSLFISNEALIKSLALPIWAYLSRAVLRSLIIFLHSFPIIPITVFVSLGSLPESAWIFIPGLIVAIGNATWMSGVIAFISTRYRDFAPIVSSLVLVLFYLTPIFWKPDILHPTAREGFLQWNPFYYMLNLLRQPWLGEFPSLLDWAVSITMALFGLALFSIVYRSLNHRVPFWL